MNKKFRSEERSGHGPGNNQERNGKVTIHAPFRSEKGDVVPVDVVDRRTVVVRKMTNDV
jgi:hypothetical protein